MSKTYDIKPKGCLIRSCIILGAEFLTTWVCVSMLNFDEGATLVSVIIVFAIIMLLALKFDKYANPYSSQNCSRIEDQETENSSVTCPYCYHINYVVDDEGYCRCEKCGAYFQKQKYDPH